MLFLLKLADEHVCTQETFDELPRLQQIYATIEFAYLVGAAATAVQALGVDLDTTFGLFAPQHERVCMLLDMAIEKLSGHTAQHENLRGLLNDVRQQLENYRPYLEAHHAGRI